ncbi:glycosyltransferase [Amycolatopsis sp. GM8]|uniref:glycosyltransferase n=1 Tax=Amycolatopsis sp. GM8 TaxID=2896530 RepID=UPI001F471DD2|nr:glycosyltransferase [Amycolatopsis sp. GM8]
MSPAFELEIVVPAFNEAARLSGTLHHLVSFLERQPWSSRLIVVDNGSADETATIARAVESPSVLITVIGCARPGKGAAVRRGMLAGTAPYVGFVDADLSTPISTLTETLRHLDAGAAAVIASRHAPGARFAQPQPFGRRLGGSAFRALTRPLVAGVHDTQCGFKFFRRAQLQKALHRCHLDGFAFDVELLRHIRAGGGQIVEIPVTWQDDRRSTFQPLRDGTATFAALFTLYRRAVAL